MRHADCYAVIMAGGRGTRFWPLSTKERPKQFLTLFGERSLLQTSFDRLSGVIAPENVLVLTGADYVGLCREQLPELPPENIIGEPIGRDTAGALALAAAVIRRRSPSALMAVLTSDHLISPRERFAELLRSALAAANESRALYTFGIKPDHPATGYGYLEAGSVVLEKGDILHLALSAFKEKPDYATARGFLESGRYFWNSGMFVWRVDVFWSELERHLPEHVRLLAPLTELADGEAFAAALAERFPQLPKISIDYGLMEKAAEVRMVLADFSWSDVGGWLALEGFYPKEGANRRRGTLHAFDAENNFAFCEDSAEEVALVGVSDLIAVRSGTRTLVATRERLEDVKKLVEGMNAKSS